MKKSRLHLAVSFTSALGLILASCAAPTATPAPEATEAPANPTTAPEPTQAPEATSAPEATQAPALEGLVRTGDGAGIEAAFSGHLPQAQFAAPVAATHALLPVQPEYALGCRRQGLAP
mgnify:CR=1 FL=1